MVPVVFLHHPCPSQRSDLGTSDPITVRSASYRACNREIRFRARAHTRRTRRVCVRAMLREDPNFLRAVCAVYAVYARCMRCAGYRRVVAVRALRTKNMFINSAYQYKHQTKYTMNQYILNGAACQATRRFPEHENQSIK